MGASFTHVHVDVGQTQPDEALARVLETLRRELAAEGWVETSEPTPGARHLWVAPADEGPWLTVYDSRSELQDDTVVTLATWLSTALPGRAFAVRVHDGDLLEVFRVQEGVLRDRWASWPGYFEGAPPPPTTPDAPPSHDALAVLAKMAADHGWSATRAQVGAASLPPSLRAKCVEIVVRRSAVEGDDHGPPAFDHVGGSVHPREVSLGESVAVTVVAHNVGGRLRGIAVVVFGPALAKGLVRPDTLVARLGDPAAPVAIVATPVVGQGEEPSWVATLPDAELPRGHADAGAAFRAEADVPAAIAGWTAARLEVELTVTAVGRGRAKLHVGLVPLENQDAGQTSWTASLRVR